MVLHAKVIDKIVTYCQRDGDIVCGNTDYRIQFLFDEEWNIEDQKTARFIWGGECRDIPFVGDTCIVPVIQNATELKVGVYVQNMSTSTPAIIKCVPSILCGSATPGETDYDIAQLEQQAIELQEQIVGQAIEFQAQISDLETTISQKETRIDELESEVSDLNNEIVMMRSPLDCSKLTFNWNVDTEDKDGGDYTNTFNSGVLSLGCYPNDYEVWDNRLTISGLPSTTRIWVMAVPVETSFTGSDGIPFAVQNNDFVTLNTEGGILEIVFPNFENSNIYQNDHDGFTALLTLYEAPQPITYISFTVDNEGPFIALDGQTFQEWIDSGLAPDGVYHDGWNVYFPGIGNEQLEGVTKDMVIEDGRYYPTI